VVFRRLRDLLCGDRCLADILLLPERAYVRTAGSATRPCRDGTQKHASDCAFRSTNARSHTRTPSPHCA